MKEEYRLAASRLRISALKQMPWRVDERGRLIGIKDVLDDFNKKYIVSEDEKKVGTNLEQMRQERINRTLEKGKRIMAGEDEQKEPEVEVYRRRKAQIRQHGRTSPARRGIRRRILDDRNLFYRRLLFGNFGRAFTGF